MRRRRRRGARPDRRRVGNGNARSPSGRLLRESAPRCSGRDRKGAFRFGGSLMELDKLKNRAAEAFAKGKFNRAAELYEEYCQKDARDMQARIRMGDAWARSGKREKAIVAYQSAAEGFARNRLFPRAIAASKLVLELDPTHKGVQHILADLYALKKGGPVSESISAAVPPSAPRPSKGASPPPARPPTPSPPQPAP